MGAKTAHHSAHHSAGQGAAGAQTRQEGQERAKDKGKGKRRETSGRFCFQDGGKCNGGRLRNIQ